MKIKKKNSKVKKKDSKLEKKINYTCDSDTHVVSGSGDKYKQNKALYWTTFTIFIELLSVCIYKLFCCTHTRHTKHSNNNDGLSK